MTEFSALLDFVSRETHDHIKIDKSWLIVMKQTLFETKCYNIQFFVNSCGSLFITGLRK